MHLDLDLTSDEPRADRPTLAVWNGESDDEQSQVVLMISAGWGAQQRFVAMSAGEARQLGKFLMWVAAEAEKKAPDAA